MLPRTFFEQPTVEVARQLIGQQLVFGNHQGLITETEAYLQDGDPACHAARGPTPRNAVMFGPAGVSYVYFIYGMYYCFNIVTEQDGYGCAVLIRGMKIDNVPYAQTNGPGKLCRFLGITREKHNGIELIGNPDFHVAATGLTPPYDATSRIGIREGKEHMWRFVVKNI